MTSPSLPQRYNLMFKANDPAAGGSFYLQSKIYRAKECLELELEQLKKAAVKGPGK